MNMAAESYFVMGCQKLPYFTSLHVRWSYIHRFHGKAFPRIHFLFLPSLEYSAVMNIHNNRNASGRSRDQDDIFLVNRQTGRGGHPSTRSREKRERWSPTSAYQPLDRYLQASLVDSCIHSASFLLSEVSL